MSRATNDRTFPYENDLETDAKFAALIASTLRSEYGGLSSAVKELARTIDVEPRTARNWYEGKNLISSRHLVLLARRSPAIRNLLFQLIGNDSALPLRRECRSASYSKHQSVPMPSEPGGNVVINVVINSDAGTLTERQRWFVNELAHNLELGPAGIARAWKVEFRTAQRDVADLRTRGIIERVGSRRAGRYIVGHVLTGPEIE